MNALYTSGPLVKILPHTSSSQLLLASMTVSAFTVAPFARPTRLSKSTAPAGLVVPSVALLDDVDRSSVR